MITLERAIAEKLPEDLIANIKKHGTLTIAKDAGDSVIAVYEDGFAEVRKKIGDQK